MSIAKVPSRKLFVTHPKPWFSLDIAFLKFVMNGVKEASQLCNLMPFYTGVHPDQTRKHVQHLSFLMRLPNPGPSPPHQYLLCLRKIFSHWIYIAAFEILTLYLSSLPQCNSISSPILSDCVQNMTPFLQYFLFMVELSPPFSETPRFIIHPMIAPTSPW